MLNVLISGLTLSSKEFLTEALVESFGEGVVELVELNKNNLRQRVRLGKKDVSIILIVLDGVSEELCADIEDGLYSSDKYYSYKDDKSFVDFLNQKYSTNIKYISEESQEVAMTSDDVHIDEEHLIMLQNQINDKTVLIYNLNSRIRELEGIIYNSNYIHAEGSPEEVKQLKDEILQLKDEILTKGSAQNENSVLIDALKEEVNSLKETITSIEKKKDTLLRNYETISSELTDYKVTYSKQSAVLRDKDTEISTLHKKLDTIGLSEEKRKELEEKVQKLTLESSQLSVDLVSKNEEIIRLNKELKNKDSDTTIEDLKSKLVDSLKERDSLQKELNVKEDELTKALKISSEDEELKQELEELKNRVKEDSASLSTLNQEKLKLQGEIELLKTSTDRDKNIEDVASELSRYKKQYEDLSENVFSKIGSYALPKGSTPINILNGGFLLKNVRFAFAGSTGSRKGAYKCLLDEFKGMNKNQRFLILDIVSETFVDYVFEIKKVVNCQEWLRKGGGLQPYLTQTCLDNVQVLSPGLGYVNDSYFLTIDWSKRLQELDNCGYNVVIFCGDISNLVGRVMHESFANLGTSIIYVQGNATGSRTVVSNLKGLTNHKSSIVAYFDYNLKMKKFYRMVEKTNECRVLSVLN